MSPVSGSVVAKAPMTVPTARLSAIEFAEIVRSAGDSLTLVTVTARAFVSVSDPSLTSTVTS